MEGPESTPVRARLYEVLSVAGLLFVAIVLRSFKLDVSLWYDETLTRVGAALPFADVLAHRYNFLYYALAHWTLKIADTEEMLRIPSVIAGVAGILALYGFARRAQGRGVALLSATLLTVAAYHIHRSQEARFYALVMLASVLMTWSLWRAITTDSKRAWFAFAAATNLGTISQLTVLPFTLSMLLAGGIAICMWPTGRGDRRVVGRLARLALCGVLSLTGLGFAVLMQGDLPVSPLAFMEDESGGVDDEGVRETATTPRDSDAFTLTLPQYLHFLSEFIPGQNTWERAAFGAFVVAGCIAAVSRTPQLALLILGQVVLAPLIFFFLPMNHWLTGRYFCSIVPFWHFFAGAGCVFLFQRLNARMVTRSGWRGHTLSPPAQRVVRWAACGLVGLVATLLLYSDVQAYYASTPSKDWRGLAHQLAPLLKEGDVVVYTRPAKRVVREALEDSELRGASCPSLEYYLRKSLAELPEGAGVRDLKAFRFISATSAGQIRVAGELRQEGPVYFVSINEPKLSRSVLRALEALPAHKTIKVRGVSLRVVSG